jgi:hypothetical protein
MEKKGIKETMETIKRVIEEDMDDWLTGHEHCIHGDVLISVGMIDYSVSRIEELLKEVENPNNVKLDDFEYPVKAINRMLKNEHIHKDEGIFVLVDYVKMYYEDIVEQCDKILKGM